MEMPRNFARSDAITIAADDLLANLLPPVETESDATGQRLGLANAWPSDALAIVEPVERSVTQSARRRTEEWKVRFAPRSAPRVDWLMGWTGSRDPLQQVELRFPSREAAEAYLNRQHLPYRMRGPAPQGTVRIRRASNDA